MIKNLLFAATAFVALSLGVNAQETVLTQNTNPTSVVEGGGVGCEEFPNSYSRSYVLSDYEITTDFTVTEIEFGMQTYTAGDEVTITLSTTSQSYPGGYPDALTELFSETFTWTENGDFVLKQVPITPTLVTAGSELVVEISGAIWCGGNSEGQSAPVYLFAAGCGVTTPTSTADIGFEDSNIIINVKGTTDASTENFAKLGLNVFPNPVSDIVNITSPEANIQAVTITDLNGRTVKSINFNNVAETTIDASDLASGIYLMNITANGTVATQKIVKK